MKWASEMIFAILKELNLFADLDDSALKILSLLFEEQEYKYGETIFEEGDVGTSMKVISQGRVRITQKADVDSQTEEALKVLKTGEVFGEMALLEELPRSATVVAHTDVIILSIERRNFIKFIEQDSKNGIKIVLRLAQTLSSRLREADMKLKTFVNLTQWI